MMDLTVRKGTSSRDSPIVTRARKTATQKIPQKKKAKRHNADKTKTGKDAPFFLTTDNDVTENARPCTSVGVLASQSSDEGDPQPTLYPSENARLRNEVRVLTEENALLRVQLKEALANKTTFQIGKSKKRPEPSSESDITETSDSDCSDSDTSSSEEEKKKKQKKKSKKRKSKHKKYKNKRVTTPDDSLQRYLTVLRKVKKGCSKAEAYSRLNVDRNTIVSQAPTGELAIANPELFETLKASFKRKDSLKRFAETCSNFCQQEPTASAIALKKENGELLNIYKM